MTVLKCKACNWTGEAKRTQRPLTETELNYGEDGSNGCPMCGSDEFDSLIQNQTKTETQV